MIRAGRLNKRVEVQTRTLAKDGYGDQTESWATEGTRWVEFVQASGREFYRAQRVDADVTHMVRMRYYKGLSPSHRLRIGSRILEILSVYDENERHEEMTVTCKEAV